MAVVNLPWLNRVDPAWLDRRSEGRRLLVTLDDHYIAGGQGEKVLAALASTATAVPTLQLGLTAVPPSGQPARCWRDSVSTRPEFRAAYATRFTANSRGGPPLDRQASHGLARDSLRD